jgi:hypothetical protein
VIITALALFGCVVLFVRAYHNAGSSSGPQAHSGGLGAGSTTPSPLPSLGPSSHSSPTTAVEDFRPSRQTLPQYTLTPGEAPGFTILGPKLHKLVLSASSAGPIPGVGYLVPTSRDHAYGQAKNLSSHWSATTSVTGKPYYALLFIQADKTGTPITCSISVDGVVKDTKTTSGPFGSQVCVG